MFGILRISYNFCINDLVNCGIHRSKFLNKYLVLCKKGWSLLRLIWTLEHPRIIVFHGMDEISESIKRSGVVTGTCVWIPARPSSLTRLDRVRCCAGIRSKERHQLNITRNWAIPCCSLMGDVWSPLPTASIRRVSSRITPLCRLVIRCGSFKLDLFYTQLQKNYSSLLQFGGLWITLEIIVLSFTLYSSVVVLLLCSILPNNHFFAFVVHTVFCSIALSQRTLLLNCTRPIKERKYSGTIYCIPNVASFPQIIPHFARNFENYARASLPLSPGVTTQLFVRQYVPWTQSGACCWMSYLHSEIEHSKLSTVWRWLSSG